jgi:hypothetical protein
MFTIYTGKSKARGRQSPHTRIESKFVYYPTLNIVTKRAELLCLRPWQKRVFNLHWILQFYFDSDGLSCFKHKYFLNYILCAYCTEGKLSKQWVL